MQAHCSIFWCVLQRLGTSSCTFFIFFDRHKYLIVEFSCTSWWTRFLSDWSVAQVVLNSDNSLAGPESPCGGFKSEHQLLSLFFLLFSCTCSSYWPIKILFCTKALLNTCIYNRLSAVVAHFFQMRYSFKIWLEWRLTKTAHSHIPTKEIQVFFFSPNVKFYIKFITQTNMFKFLFVIALMIIAMLLNNLQLNFSDKWHHSKRITFYFY